jgi:signal transduction histidine kinase
MGLWWCVLCAVVDYGACVPRRAGVSIRYETTKQVPQQITTDRTRLMQLITGLVLQALRIRNDDFMAREQRLSGDIVVSVSANEDEDEAQEGKEGGSPLVSAQRRNQLRDAGHQSSTLHIVVQGAGVMIRDDEIAALLDPFARAAAGAVSLPKLGGTSLGTTTDTHTPQRFMAQCSETSDEPCVRLSVRAYVLCDRS